MKILITGSGGFVGKNLVSRLENIRDGKDKTHSSDIELMLYDIDTKEELLDTYARECDFVFHLAGVNRPKEESEFMEGNFGFTSRLLELLEKHGSTAPVLVTSSIQAQLDNPYGRSKREGEKLIFDYGKRRGIRTCVYRLENVFGKWCRPNYNSAVATFCHNIANGLPIKVNDREHMMRLVYIDDVTKEFIRALDGEENRCEDGFCRVPQVHEAALGEIADLLYSFKESRSTLAVSDMGDEFTKKLYSTYLSYLPTDGFSYPLTMHCDERGSFTEILKTPERGQFSVNISKPGIVKGNHWHHTKNEKFVVVSGRGVIRLRKVGTDEVIEYFVSGDSLEVVDIPCGYTHNIENIGDEDMVTFMWANEVFDPENPDTFYLEV
ncbi:MAG: capsular polysaccharide biosynthesis protein CapF [Clostridiales bacterium]|nr:capsular polysaccharide biosynthesis protein CapF [Clostridiales bacterium]